MSTTSSPGIERTLRGCRPADVDPVVIDASDLDSTAPDHLRDLKQGLAARGYQPAAVATEAEFDADSTLERQREADRLRGLVRAASFLGAGRIEVSVAADAACDEVRTVLAALSERADREGVELVRVGADDAA
ncbi:sugar phosphate isomerase/epimerase [Halorubrum hochsteinianum]|uniref:sugar phosphate isomerase/epimerase n=1 Tax=Halorubrum hochsteinianum TaxID=2949307 RepID=UPI002036B063|nr:sugar phosphate isomerase/epimerase [Halorubrum hochsteinianum]